MTNETLVHEGITYRMVSRKASVGEKVMAVSYNGYFDRYGEVLTAESFLGFNDGSIQTEDGSFFDVTDGDSYVVLEPIADSDELTLTEADVRNNPRQVIDLLVNLALRLTKAEKTIERLDKRIDDEAFLSDEWADEIDDRIDRLASANEQAITTVARNVETWAQEHESLKRKVADINERTQPYQQAHELFVKIAGGLPRELKNTGRSLTDEERREL